MAIKKFKAPEQHQFVLTGPFVETIFKGGSYALSLGYTDHKGVIKDSTQSSGQKGRYVEYITSKDEKGKDKAKRYKFDQSLGRILTRPTDTDIYGKSQYEFLKNHAQCEGSPNGTYEDDGKGGHMQVGIVFRELNTTKDAAVALKADRLRNKAESNAFALDDQTLEEMANIIGYFGEVDDLMLSKVVEYARRYPGPFDELLKSEDRGIRAVIRKAIDESIFKENGEVLKWEQTIIGKNEDDAIATLRKDKAMLTALQEKLGFDVEAVTKSKKKAAEVA